MGIARVVGLGFASLPAWSWKGALLLAVAGAGALLLHRRSPALRHLLWSGALAGVLILPLAERLPVAWRLPLPQSSAKAPAGLDRLLPAATVLPAAIASAGNPPDFDTRAAGAPLHHASPSLVPLPLAVPSWFLVTIWAGGALLGLTRLGGALLRRRQLSDGAQALSAEWQLLAAECAARLGLRRPVRLLGSDETEVPMTWGILRPVVLLPASAARWSPAQRYDVLLHELAHVGRGDAVALDLSHLACLVHWFDPLAWLAARRLREEAEHACDDLVLLAGSRPSLYAGHLLAVARALRAALPSAALVLAMARQPRLARRIAAILDDARDRRPPGRVAAAITLLACAMLVLPLAAASTRPAKEALAQRPAEASAQLDANTPGPAVVALSGASAGPQGVPVDDTLEPVRPQTAVAVGSEAGEATIVALGTAIPATPSAPATITPAIATAISPPLTTPVEDVVIATAAVAAGSIPDAHASKMATGPLASLAPEAASISPALAVSPTPLAPQAPVAAGLPADDFTFWTAECRDSADRPSKSIRRDGSGWKIRFEKGRCRLDIDVRGGFRLSADGRGINPLGPGSRLHITDFYRRTDLERGLAVPEGSWGPGLRPRGTVRELIVENRSGAPRLSYRVDGYPKHFTPAVRN
jgi:beta-lactamase regulating signal transducer with metallopeptidase domain